MSFSSQNVLKHCLSVLNHSHFRSEGFQIHHSCFPCGCPCQSDTRVKLVILQMEVGTPGVVSSLWMWALARAVEQQCCRARTHTRGRPALGAVVDARQVRCALFTLFTPGTAGFCLPVLQRRLITRGCHDQIPPQTWRVKQKFGNCNHIFCP